MRGRECIACSDSTAGGCDFCASQRRCALVYGTSSLPREQASGRCTAASRERGTHHTTPHSTTPVPNSTHTDIPSHQQCTTTDTRLGTLCSELDSTAHSVDTPLDTRSAGCSRLAPSVVCHSLASPACTGARLHCTTCLHSGAFQSLLRQSFIPSTSRAERVLRTTLASPHADSHSAHTTADCCHIAVRALVSSLGQSKDAPRGPLASLSSHRHTCRSPTNTAASQSSQHHNSKRLTLPTFHSKPFQPDLHHPAVAGRCHPIHYRPTVPAVSSLLAFIHPNRQPR